MSRASAYVRGPSGHDLGYRYHHGSAPAVVFLGGFRSDMSGTKARYLEARALSQGRAVLCLDYGGHGTSGGRFEDCTISSWCADVHAVLDAVQPGPVLLVGSSMGGWIMTLVARSRGAQVRGLLGIAAAPDFTEELLWPRLDATARRELETSGSTQVPSRYGDGPYPITRALIEDGRTQRVLTAPIPVDVPVRLLHGLADEDVPWRLSVALAEALRGADVRVTLLKHGAHRLSEPAELAEIGALLDELHARTDC